MKYFVLLLLILPIFCFSQEIPKKTSLSASELAKYLTKDIADENQEEKVRAIYTWITNNIEYDYKKISSDKLFTATPPEKALKSKKVLCSGYCLLLSEMCNEIGINTEVISGYVKPINWIKGENLYLDTHIWIAIEINGVWKLADPTWDSGYIGPIPKKKKKKKKGKEDEEKKSVDEIEYTGKTGFVFEPKEHWFLAHSDTFLLKHLPVNPMWQLRKDTISISDFTLTNDSLIARLSKDKKGNYPFKNEITRHGKRNFVEQLIHLAEDGNQYNPKNARTKAVGYYNFLEILLHKEVKKEYKDLPVTFNEELYTALLQKNDTVELYIKKSKDIEKNEFKNRKTLVKNIYKDQKVIDKQHLSNAKSGSPTNNKTIKNIEKCNERIKKENIKLLKIITNTYTKNNGFDNIPLIKNLDALPRVKVFTDTISELKPKFAQLHKDYIKKTDSTELRNIINTLNYVEYLFNLNRKVIEFNSFAPDSLIKEINFLIDSNFIALSSFYSDSLPKEIIPQSIYFNAQHVSDLNSRATDSLMYLYKSKKIKEVHDCLIELHNENITFLREMIAINERAYSYNINLIANLKNFSKKWSTLYNLAEQQIAANDKKNTHILEADEHSHNREEDLFTQMAQNAKIWKKQLSEQLKE